jgi:hypothetical protein
MAVDPYVATYKVNPLAVLGVPGYLLLLLAAILFDVDVGANHIPRQWSLWGRLGLGLLAMVTTAVLVGIAGILLGHLIAGLTRRVALRADEAGVTLGGVGLFGLRRPVFVPWQDIIAIVRFREPRLVGLQLRPDVPRPGGLSRLRYRVPADIVRPVVGYRIDSVALIWAVVTYAPHVEILWPAARGRRVRLPTVTLDQRRPARERRIRE